MIVNFELLSLLRRLIQRLLMMDADASWCIASIISWLEIDLKFGLMVIDFLLCFNFYFRFYLVDSLARTTQNKVSIFWCLDAQILSLFVFLMYHYNALVWLYRAPHIWSPPCVKSHLFWWGLFRLWHNQRVIVSSFHDYYLCLHSLVYDIQCRSSLLCRECQIVCPCQR